MLDLEIIRSQPKQVQEVLQRRGEEINLEPVLELDVRRRELIRDGDLLRNRRNEVSKRIGQMKEKPPELIREMREVGERIKALEEAAKDLETELTNLLLAIPNIPEDDVPIGLDDSANVVVRTHGEPLVFPFTPMAHWDLTETLGIVDLPRGAKLSGSRFYVIRGLGAQLQRALISWMLTLQARDHGYTEIAIPYLVRRESMIGSGNLPKFGGNLYHDDEDDLWLIPTAEVPLTNLHREEILEPGTLPLYYVAHTPCFRREKAAAGKDTRGIKRVHQFDKVELYKFVVPEHSDQELQSLVKDAEEVCRALKVPYRVTQLCTGDLGFQSAKSYDLEIWAPGSGEWLEVSSCSNCTDFQARRADIRFRREAGSRPEYVHTINGSGLAVPRVLIAILENYQQADGSVLVPEVLQSYTGFDVIAPAQHR